MCLELASMGCVCECVWELEHIMLPTAWLSIGFSWHQHSTYVPKEINFPRYNMKCSAENVILRGIFHVMLCFPLYCTFHVIAWKFGLLSDILQYLISTIRVNLTGLHIWENRTQIIFAEVQIFYKSKVYILALLQNFYSARNFKNNIITHIRKGKLGCS